LLPTYIAIVDGEREREREREKNRGHFI